MENIYFSMDTKVYFGRDSLSAHLHLIKKLGTKALIVTGKKSAFESGLVDKVTGICSQNGITCVLYPGVNPEPDISDVENGALVCREEKCDVIVGIGGGSAMDAAKAIAVLATNPGGIRDYFGEKDYTCLPLPVAVIPTTCGTGSEVTRFAVIMDREARTKKTVSSEKILPRIAILDPETLTTLPKHLVVATGMDAFSHSAESYLSSKADYLSRVFALESLKLLWKYLPMVEEDKKGDARSNIFLASLLAGLAINRTGTIIVHGMGYSLTVTRETHHGTANALLLPYVFEYLKKNGYHNEFTELEQIWVETEHLKDFVKKLGLPSKLRDLGITEADIDGLTELSELGAQRAVKNMKMLIGNKEFKEILLSAL